MFFSFCVLYYRISVVLTCRRTNAYVGYGSGVLSGKHTITFYYQRSAIAEPPPQFGPGEVWLDRFRLMPNDVTAMQLPMRNLVFEHLGIPMDETNTVLLPP